MPTLADLLGLAQPSGGAFGTYSPQEQPNLTPGDVLTAAGAGEPWMDRARRQAASDLAAYQQGGVPQLMEQTANPMGLAGGFGGSIKGVGGPIRAYHGSPYDFERFDLSKIGTGEGAQAYGHGLYFAESEPTAMSYKNAPHVTDMNWPVESSIDSILKGTEANYADVPAWVARGSLSSPTRADEILKDFQQRAADMKAEGHWNAQGIQNIVDTLQAVKSGAATFKRPGHMYEVNINAAPEQFLNWDRPMSEQPSSAVAPLLEAVKNEAYNRALASTSKTRADELWSMVKNPMQAPGGFAQDLLRRPEITQQLGQGGIPGIRYLDQLSRGGGQGTSNYVVFNPDIVDIIRKYGLAGAVTPAGVLMGAGQPAQPQQQ